MPSLLSIATSKQEAVLRFTKTGLVVPNFYVAGHSWAPCYLLDGSRPIIFESGFTCVGRMYEDALKEILKGREPEILFLSHVHYDHCGATARLKRAFPSLIVAASRPAADIIRRPNARVVMKELSAEAFLFASSTLGIDESMLTDEPFEPFDVDVTLVDRQCIELDGATVHVLATPGHTRDMLSYYIPERKILIGGEAVGCEEMTGRIIISPLADFDAYLSSLAKLSVLEAEVLCQGHRVVWVGAEEVHDYFARALATAKEFKETVINLLGDEAGSIERVVSRIKAMEYDTNKHVKQQETAYLVNLRAIVGNLSAKMKQ